MRSIRRVGIERGVEDELSPSNHDESMERELPLPDAVDETRQQARIESLALG